MSTSRMKRLEMLQQLYPTFSPFLKDALEFLGFAATTVQLDIGNFISNSAGDIMVQAQRGQAKSTITAIYAVWWLIHRPTGRVLIVSAGGKQANEISVLVTRLILNWDILECIRPDRSAGDRVSVEAFDLHHSLKGIDKSPSVACTGITANLQGKRADLLIADDVESEKNSRTQMMRELLMQWTRDFSSIVQNGRVVYLGTPQSVLSIYNTLPSRGVNVRIWPGRFPTAEQIRSYGALLAPSILAVIGRFPHVQSGGGVDGSQGLPTDPMLLNEEALQKKELAQGTAYFQLQHMLNTAMVDAARFPLKSTQLVVMRLADKLPDLVVRGMAQTHFQKYQIGSEQFEVSWPSSIGTLLMDRALRVMFIDPAGGGKNADETAWACVDVCNSRMFVRECAGQAGGYELAKLEALAKRVVQLAPDVLVIEKNFGHGAFAAVFQPVLAVALAAAGNSRVQIVEEYQTGKKEDRIIDTLEPIIGRGALVIDESVLLEDWDSTSRYAIDKRQTYTFATQLSRITRDAGALLHDDRIDALAGACAYAIKHLRLRDDVVAERRRAAELAKWQSNPLNVPDYALAARGFRLGAPKKTGKTFRK